MGKWRLVAKVTNEYHKKETKQRISVLKGTIEIAESGEEEVGGTTGWAREQILSNLGSS